MLRSILISGILYESESEHILFHWLSILENVTFPKRCVLSLTVIFKITIQHEVTWCPDTYSSDNSECRLVHRKNWDDGVLKVFVKKFLVVVKKNSKYNAPNSVVFHGTSWSVFSSTDNGDVVWKFAMSKSRIFRVFRCDSFFRKLAGRILCTWDKLFLRHIEEHVNSVNVKFHDGHESVWIWNFENGVRLLSSSCPLLIPPCVTDCLKWNGIVHMWKSENIDMCNCFVLIFLFVWICASTFFDVSRSMRCSGPFYSCHAACLSIYFRPPTRKIAKLASVLRLCRNLFCVVVRWEVLWNSCSINFLRSNLFCDF